MSNLDDAIRDALSEEDAEFMARLDRESSHIVRSMFTGTWGWLNVVLIVVVVAILPVTILATVNFLHADEVQEMLRWLSGAALGVVFLTVIRLWFNMHIQTDRVIREVKRLELQVARLAARRLDRQE